MLVSSQFSSTVTVLNDVSTSIFYSESCKILSSTNIIDKLPSHSSIQRACFELDGSVWFIHQSNPILWYHPLIVDGLVTLNRLPKHLVMNDGWLFHNHFLSTQCDNLEPTFRVVLEVDEGWNSMVWFWGEAVHKEKVISTIIQYKNICIYVKQLTMVVKYVNMILPIDTKRYKFSGIVM